MKLRGNTAASLSSPLPYMSVKTRKKRCVWDLLFRSHLPFIPPSSLPVPALCLPHPPLSSSSPAFLCSPPPVLSLSSLIPPPQRPPHPPSHSLPTASCKHVIVRLTTLVCSPLSFCSILLLHTVPDYSSSCRFNPPLYSSRP